MDALARLEPVARPLLRQVDEALATLGAPPAHPVWSLVRRTGATPADAVGFFADAAPDRLHAVTAALRNQGGVYAASAIPAGVPWEGGAGEAYSMRATALDTHLRADMAGRLESTASYVEAIADWYQRARDRIAHALADVLGSAQAVIVRGQGASSEAEAAADIGACLLAAAAQSLDDAHDLRSGWNSRLAEAAIKAPAEPGLGRFDSRIHLSR